MQGLLVAFFGLCGSCNHAEAVAKVNGTTIEKKDFDQQVDRNMQRYRAPGQSLPPDIEVRIRESVLRRMVDDEIIAQRAKDMQLTVADAELDSKFKEHKDRFRSDQAFNDYLKRSNNTELNLKDDLRRSLLRDRVVEKITGQLDVTEAEVKKYYEDNAKRFDEPEQIKARRIVVRLPQPTTPADKKAKQKIAQKLHDAALKKGADFAKIAREHSEGPEAAHDGEMGGFFARGHMPPEFDEVAFKLEPQAVSPVVETKLGLEIIEVLEKKPQKQKPFEEVKENIRTALLARLRNDKRRDALRDLKAQAKVEVLLKFETPPPGPGSPPPGAAPIGLTPPASPGHPAPIGLTPPASPGHPAGEAGAPPPPAAVPPPAVPPGPAPAPHP